MPEETIFSGHYSVQISKPSNMHEFVPTPSGFGMTVTVHNPDQKEILSRSYGAEGKFSFTSDQPGEFLVCMGSNATSSFNILKSTQQRLRVTFKIKVGEHTQNYQEIAQQEELTEMGYDPYFVGERVALAGSEVFLNVHEDNNYE